MSLMEQPLGSLSRQRRAPSRGHLLRTAPATPDRMHHQLVAATNSYEYIPNALSSGARAARRARNDAARLDRLSSSSSASLYGVTGRGGGGGGGGGGRGRHSASAGNLGERSTYLADLPLEPTQLPELRCATAATAAAAAAVASPYMVAAEGAVERRPRSQRAGDYPRSPHSAAGPELRAIASRERLYLASRGHLGPGGMGAEPIGNFVPPRRDSPHSGGRSHSTPTSMNAHAIDLAEQGIRGSGTAGAPKAAKAASAARNRDQAGTVLGFSTLHMRTLEFEMERRE